MKSKLVVFLSLFPTMVLAELDSNRLSNEVYYQSADKIAIVKTLSGNTVPTANEGAAESRVISKVLVPVKGVQQDDELEIYGGAAELNAEYLVLLRWDEKAKGYRSYPFFPYGMNAPVQRVRAHTTPITDDLSVERVATIRKMNEISVQEVKKTLGFHGDVTIYGDWIYFPNCQLLFQKICQKDFELVQYVLGKLPKK